MLRRSRVGSDSRNSTRVFEFCSGLVDLEHIGRLRAALGAIDDDDLVELLAQRYQDGTYYKEELMKKALMGASAAAVIALVPLGIPPAQAHADNPCVSITDPAAHQACIDEFLRDDPMHRYQMGDCQGSPDYGAEGQFCRNFWVRKSAPPASRQLSEL